MIEQSLKIFIGMFLSGLAATSCAAQTSEDVIVAFKNSGLEAENSTPMGPKSYGFAPYVCKGSRFLIPSLGNDSGGRVLVCPNTEERDAIAGYYERLGKKSAAFFSWVFIKGNTVVQINGDLEEEKARKYERAIP
jgi:hypothetical protein